MTSPAYSSAYDAIARGDEAALSELLRTHSGLAAEHGDRIERPHTSLLEHAVWFRPAGMAKLLVDAEAPLGEPGDNPAMTPLARAPELGATEIARLLGAPASTAEAVGLNDVQTFDRKPATSPDETRRSFRLACINGARETATRCTPGSWCGAEALTHALMAGRHLLTWDEGETASDWAQFQLELADPANVFEPDIADGQGLSVFDRLGASGLQSLVPTAPPLATRAPPPPT